MRQSCRGIFIVLFLSFVLGLAGCQQKGTAVKAGQKVDQATESAKNKIEKAGEAVAEKVEKAGDEMEDFAITAKAEILNDPLLKVSQINVTPKCRFAQCLPAFPLSSSSLIMASTVSGARVVSLRMRATYESSTSRIRASALKE